MSVYTLLYFMLRKVMCVVMPDAPIATDMDMLSATYARATASSSGTSNSPLSGKLITVAGSSSALSVIQASHWSLNYLKS